MGVFGGRNSSSGKYLRSKYGELVPVPLSMVNMSPAEAYAKIFGDLSGYNPGSFLNESGGSLGAGGSGGDTQVPTKTGPSAPAASPFSTPLEDQQTIEQEGLRQRGQGESLLAKTDELSKSRLGDLASLLSQEAHRQFLLNQPLIAEQAQAGGYRDSTGYADALAREEARLAGDTAFQIGQQGISDRDTYTRGLADILASQQGFQSSGLQRRFSLEDYARQVATAKEIGANSTPAVGGGKSGAFSQGASGAIIGGSVGGPVGAGIGGGLGLLSGLAGGKKGK